MTFGYVLGAAIAFLILMGIWAWFSLPGSLSWFAVRAMRKEDAALRRQSTQGLVDEARRCIRAASWERFGAAQHILTPDHWTDTRLLEELRALSVEVASETPGQVGPGSNMFAFYESGLMSILEVLAERLKRG